MIVTLLLLLAGPPETSLPNTSRAALEQYALTHAGDAEAGKAVYASEAMKCAICHQLDDVPHSKGIAGPNLTAIGNKFDRPHIVDALLHPSREIGYGYQTQVVRLDDGRVLSGIVKQRDDDTLTLVDAGGKTTAIATEAIEAEKASDVSLMPAGLFDTVSPEDFTDLVAYLESRRPGGSGKMGAGITGPITVPAGWSVRVVATGLDGLTALETLPDGRVLVCEQTGAVRLIRGDVLQPEPVVTLPVDDTWERGVIGVTVAPNFPADPSLFVAWVAKEPYPHHRISRFTMDGDVALPGSETVIFEGDDQRQYKGQRLSGHQGGGLHFGPDGCLYLGIGEHTARQPAQRFDNFLGKIIRLHPDGRIPADNPLLDRTDGKYGAIWATGCRNPFTFAFRQRDGLMLINDVGGRFEEINVGRPGANFGWPAVDHGPLIGERSHTLSGPIHWYPQSSINGGDFAPAGRPDAGRYYFADYVLGVIRSIDPAAPRKSTPLASGFRRPVDIRFDADGSLYVLLRNAWVIDDRYVRDAGSVVKLTPPE